MKILYLDFETTGLETGKDRIVELAFILEEDGVEIERWQNLINPNRPIPSEVTAIHGIKDSDVKDAPSFQDLVDRIEKVVHNCDVFAGYNVLFDLKILMAEVRRCGRCINFHSKQVWDMQKIFFHHEPRNLAAAYRYYCKGEHEGAHRALNDVEVTIEIFKAQQEKYQLELTRPMDLKYAEARLPLDSNGAFAFIASGEIELTFGKHRGKKLTNLTQELKNYLSWMISAKFPDDTKAIAQAILKGRQVTKDNLAETVAHKI